VATQADPEFWNRFFRQRRESGNDLDWKGLWTEPFLFPLREAGTRTILELGCGTGNDAARLAGEGYSVTATDLSDDAIGQARAKFGSQARFLLADMTQRLPFPSGDFDAVMSNVALHMFPDGVTRALFAEVGRLIRPGGLFLFHVNALEDRPLRARNLPARELEPDYVVEESGQTMHFFSADYLRELLAGWRDLELTAIPVAHPQTGEPYKRVWRGIARR
jgi:SAM-dependent methyltransferase